MFAFHHQTPNMNGARDWISVIDRLLYADNNRSNQISNIISAPVTPTVNHAGNFAAKSSLCSSTNLVQQILINVWWSVIEVQSCRRPYGAWKKLVKKNH